MKFVRNALLSVAVSAPFALAAAEPAASPPKAEGEARVCFSEARTGSNIKKRICMTEKEREARRQADQEAVQGFKGGSAGRSNAAEETSIRR